MSEKVKISTSDLVAEFLEDQIASGEGITITKKDNGGNQYLEISAATAASSAEVTSDGYEVKIDSSDLNPDFLSGKIAGGENVNIVVLNDGGNKTLEINATYPELTGIEQDVLGVAGAIQIILKDLDGYATLVIEDQRWIDSSGQRQDIRDALIDGYADLAIENQRWVDSSGQRQDLRMAADGYSTLVIEEQRWVDSSQQRQDLRDAADAYGAKFVIEDQRWVDSSTQRQDIRDVLDGYTAGSSAEADQRWTDSSQQRQDLRNSADGYGHRGEFHNFALKSHTTTTVTSNGSTVTLSLTGEGTADIVIFREDGTEFIFDATPAATVTLTAGSDTAPLLNCVYILNSNNTLTTNVDTWPAQAHTKISSVVVQSASGVQTDGVYKCHQWDNHVKDGYGEGMQQHVTEWIRNQHTTWKSGAVTTATGGSATFDVAVTSARIFQLHEHQYPAFDTAGSDSIFMVNDNSTPFKKVGDLVGELTDSTGSSMSGKTYFMVIWGVVSTDLTDSKLFCNVPSGSYNNSGAATNDPNGTSVFTIPSAFKGSGFLIANIQVSHAAGGGGTFTIDSTEDLTGTFPSQVAGTTLTAVTSFPDTLFRVVDDGDSTKQIAFQASGVSASTTRTITMPDRDLTLVGVTGTMGDGYLSFWTGTHQIAGDNDLYWDRANNRLGIGTSAPASKLHVAGVLTAGGDINLNGNQLLLDVDGDTKFTSSANDVSIEVGGAAQVQRWRTTSISMSVDLDMGLGDSITTQSTQGYAFNQSTDGQNTRIYGVSEHIIGVQTNTFDIFTFTGSGPGNGTVDAYGSLLLHGNDLVLVTDSAAVISTDSGAEGKIFFKAENTAAVLELQSTQALFDINVRINDEKTLTTGVISMREANAPAAIDGYGHLYVQEDGYLYYKDLGGIETNLVQRRISQLDNLVPSGTTVTLDFSLTKFNTLDLGSASGDVTVTMINPNFGETYGVRVIQGGTARDIVWPSNVLWPQAGTAPVISTGDDEVDFIQFLYDGESFLGLFAQDFS